MELVSSVFMVFNNCNISDMSHIPGVHMASVLCLNCIPVCSYLTNCNTCISVMLFTFTSSCSDTLATSQRTVRCTMLCSPSSQHALLSSLPPKAVCILWRQLCYQVTQNQIIGFVLTSTLLSRRRLIFFFLPLL